MSVPRCEVCAGVEICLRCSCSRQACVLESIFKQSMKITVTRSVWWERGMGPGVVLRLQRMTD